MQNQTQRVCPSGAAHSFEPDSASCIRILHPASGAKASGFGPDSAFCILHLHSASASCIGCSSDTALGLILHSAFCICILHDVMCGARAQKAEIWRDSYSRAQITHDHLLP